MIIGITADRHQDALSALGVGWGARTDAAGLTGFLEDAQKLRAIAAILQADFETGVVAQIAHRGHDHRLNFRRDRPAQAPLLRSPPSANHWLLEKILSGSRAAHLEGCWPLKPREMAASKG